MVARSIGAETDRGNGVSHRHVSSDVTDVNAVINAHLEWMEDEHPDRRPRRYSQRSIHDRAGCLDRADRALPRGLCDVYPTEIRDYLSNPEWSEWTRHTYDGHLRGFYAWGTAAGWLTCDPMVGLAAQPSGQFLPRPLTAQELRLALQLSEDPWYTCIILGVGAGLRASEMAALVREDITDEYVLVRRGKGGRGRVVPTCNSVWSHLRDRPGGPVLRRSRGRPVTGSWLSACQHRHWSGIGLPQIHLHRLRHTFCSIMYDAGHDPLVLRDLMGHASVVTTQGYALVSGRKRLQALAAVDELLASLGAPASL